MVLTAASVSAVADGESVSCPSGAHERCPRRDVDPRSSATPRVVLLRGEHDCATADDLRDLLSGVIALDDADVVVDLRDVTFMGAATFAVLATVRDTLTVQRRGLAVRAPSNFARRMLDVCGLSDLVEAPPDAEPAPAAKAS